jgi:hypothetical protein
MSNEGDTYISVDNKHWDVQAYDKVEVGTRMVTKSSRLFVDIYTHWFDRISWKYNFLASSWPILAKFLRQQAQFSWSQDALNFNFLNFRPDTTHHTWKWHSAEEFQKNIFKTSCRLTPIVILKKNQIDPVPHWGEKLFLKLTHQTPIKRLCKTHFDASEISHTHPKHQYWLKFKKSALPMLHRHST